MIYASKEAQLQRFRVSVFDDAVGDALRQDEVEPVLAEMASEIIECEDVLGLFATDWRRLVAGEEKNAKILYLVATSRLLPKSMHAAIKGPSGCFLPLPSVLR